MRTKRVVVFLIAVITAIPMMLFSACGSGSSQTEKVGTSSQTEKVETSSQTEKVGNFYGLVVQSQECLDKVADDIYAYWYDAIYGNKYGGNISLAVYWAKQDNEENLTTIEANEVSIQAVYKEIKNSEFSEQIKAVMSAYSDYYELVVNVSGSFSTYSANKETLKKELASALKNLALEI